MERRTRQREAIWAFICKVDRPVGPLEILKGAKSSATGLGIATVYRTIKALRAERKLVPVGIPGHPTRYEMAGLEHHHHFFCDACGKVFELEGCGLRTAASVPEGFQVSRHDVTLYGRCAECGS